MKRRKKPITESLDPSIPMGINKHGIVMVFRRNLSEREIERAFDLFHLAAVIETPGGHYFRPDDRANPPDTPAFRVYQAIEVASKQ